MKKLVLLIALIPSILHAECKIEEKSVIYLEVPSYMTHGSVATADVLNGKYVITYEPDVKYFPKILQDHIFAHECAHHRLKHTLLPKSYRSDEFEFDADCDAVKQLNWTDKEILDLISIWNTLYPKDYVETIGNTLKRCLHQN